MITTAVLIDSQSALYLYMFPLCNHLHKTGEYVLHNVHYCSNVWLVI